MRDTRPIRAPIDAESEHAPTRTYSRAYLHHLVKANEMLGAILLSSINLAYYQQLMRGIRAAIEAGTFETFRAADQRTMATRRSRGRVGGRSRLQ